MSEQTAVAVKKPTVMDTLEKLKPQLKAALPRSMDSLRDQSGGDASVRSLCHPTDRAEEVCRV